ncbi:hypothetical protein EYE40_08835 [Glaciihabitans arcticus]|uniref:Uncharacterized protein n=1 Tax=Glaciihabitans arcticus TaxID=2668039 RepID=A0A4Q9GSC9_9MICO|nr:hypothetical protein [Glaciihabitans arcticus]TBN57485.1 hypothetical protein EYE40_08835 [Glaciihabitans arcticus]
MPTLPRITLVVLACAVWLVGAAVAGSDASYSDRRVSCILVPSGAELPALTTPPVQSGSPAILAFPVESGTEAGSTSTVLWEDVYGEQHIAVDPDDALREQLLRNGNIQLARACASS